MLSGDGVPTWAVLRFPGLWRDKSNDPFSRGRAISDEGRYDRAARPRQKERTRSRFRRSVDDVPGARCRPGSWLVRRETRRGAGHGTEDRDRIVREPGRCDTREISGEAGGRFRAW